MHAIKLCTVTLGQYPATIFNPGIHLRYLNVPYDLRFESLETYVCVCVYLWSGLVKNILSLNDVSHHSVFQLLVLVSSQVDGL